MTHFRQFDRRSYLKRSFTRVDRTSELFGCTFSTAEVKCFSWIMKYCISQKANNAETYIRQGCRSVFRSRWHWLMNKSRRDYLLKKRERTRRDYITSPWIMSKWMSDARVRFCNWFFKARTKLIVANLFYWWNYYNGHVNAGSNR
jgi:hypothetical protein